jgi:hypothetical protein
MKKVVELEIEKARKVLENFEKLPAQDIKSIVFYLMGAINQKVVSVNDNLEDLEKDFLVASENQILPREMGNMYFFLKSLYMKDFKKSDRDAVLVKSWKNNVYLNKSYFKGMIDSVENLVESFN